MLGVLSFLAFLCAAVFLVSLVLLILRLVKKKPWKPLAVIAAVSVVCVLGLSMPISQMYVPAEKPAAPAAGEDTTSAVESTANVDNSVENVENSTANVSYETVPAQSAAPEATQEPVSAPAESTSPAESTAAPETEPVQSADPAGPASFSDLRFNDEPISDVAVRDLSGTSGVLDVFIEADEASLEINITVQVPAGSDQEAVKSTGERVARYLASLACYSDSGYSLPDEDSLGGLYDVYSLLLYLDDGGGNVNAYGAKVPLSPAITWRFPG